MRASKLYDFDPYRTAASNWIDSCTMELIIVTGDMSCKFLRCTHFHRLVFPASSSLLAFAGVLNLSSPQESAEAETLPG